jgi:hypothetical protein
VSQGELIVKVDRKPTPTRPWWRNPVLVVPAATAVLVAVIEVVVPAVSSGFSDAPAAPTASPPPQAAAALTGSSDLSVVV